MDIEKEMNLVYSKIKDQKNLIIFAKSLGTVLAMKLMIDQWFLPKKCIFVWLPLWYIRNMWFPLKTYLSKIPCPVLFIQNKDDPAGSYLEVVREVGQISNDFSFVELPGNDHDYSDVEKLSEVISNYLI
jgi:predicted alpha/beta-hydrolase family hydrolase